MCLISISQPPITSPLCRSCQVAGRVFFEPGLGGLALGWAAGRRVVAGPGVACPKSWCSGCEPAALESESFPGCPPGTRPDCGSGPSHGGAWTRPSAPRRSHRRSPAAGPLTAAPRPPPRGHRSGRSCSCPRPAAAGPVRPAWAARQGPARRPPPAAGPRAGPARRRPRPTAQVRSGQAAAHPTSFSAWAAQARTRSSPSGSSVPPIATAVCDPLCGSTPIITAVISTLQLIVTSNGDVAGMPNYGFAIARTSFEPRHGETRRAGTSL